jgi:hypothetical protein
MTSHARDLALRAVGRNVVNFQRLEGCLKLLAKLQPVDGTLHQIRTKLEARMERLSKSTLGSAIAGWLNLLDHTTTATDLPEDLFDVTARFAFTVELADDEKDRHADALSKLLVERNTLIHDGLLSIDWESPEQCRKLTANLDAQNERIGKEINFLLPILRMLSETANELNEMDWAEAMSEIQKRDADESTPNHRPESDA